MQTNSKKWLRHFFDSLSGAAFAAPLLYERASGQTSLCFYTNSLDKTGTISLMTSLVVLTHRSKFSLLPQSRPVRKA